MEIASGRYINKYKYDSPLDAASPWSLVLALMPETVPPKEYVRALDKEPLSSSKGDELEEETAAFVSSTNSLLGWSVAPADDDDAAAVAQLFMQLRIRQIDHALGSINWDPGAKFVDSPWYKGIVRPLSLLREKYAQNLGLGEFEAMTPGQVAALVRPLLSAANSPHIINYVVEPYATFLNCPDLLQSLAEEVPLSAVLKLSSSNPGLAPALVANCYRSTPLNLGILEEIGCRINNQQLISDTRVARILGPERLQDIADIRTSDKETRQNTVSSFVSHYTNPLAGIWPDLDLLTSALDLPESTVRGLVLNEAARRGDFDLINLEKSKWPESLVKAKTTEYISRTRTQLISGEKEAGAIPSILAALGIIGDQEGSLQYKAIQSLFNRYGLSPCLVLTSSPSTLFEKILEVQPRAYQRQNALISEVSNATQSKVDIDKARGQFVGFALVDNNFNAAVQLCEAMDPANEATWIAYLQTTRFISTLWDYTPPKILAKKKELITTCIKICPPGDIATVLKVRDALYDTPTPRALSQSSAQGPSRGHTPEGTGPGGKRKAVQNLLVSGIGWAIGAPAAE